MTTETTADSSGEAVSPDPLIFLHLTKVAGGTLKTALGATEGLRIAFVYSPDEIARLEQTPLDGFDLIYGHAVYGLHERLNIAPRYLCYVRHPVTRTISHYYHLRNVDRGPVGDRIRESRDIDDFFARMTHWEFSDFMTKVISGIGNAPPPEGVNLFRKAVANIDRHFLFVGFQEYFPLSTRRLRDILGTEVVPTADINVGRYDLRSISSETIDRIEALNVGDLKLYKYCLAKFL